MYRKLSEKSRALAAAIGGNGDRLLFFAALAFVAALIVTALVIRTVGSSWRIELVVSSQCERLFGRETMDALIREFGEQRPDMRIRIAEQGADLVFFDDSAFGGMAQAGALHSLASYIHTENAASEWAIPLVSFMDLFVYNITILKAAGFDRPPKTRLEFLDCARAVAAMHNNAPDVYSYALGLSGADPLALRREFFAWMWAAGGEIRPPANERGLPEFSRPAEEIFGFFAQLNREGLLAPDAFTTTGAERIGQFAQGKIAMMTISARDLPLLKKRMGAALGLSSIPAAMALGKPRLELSAIYAGISAECVRQDEAWSFLAFLAEQGKTLSAALTAIPGSLPDALPGVSAFPGDYILEDPLYSKAWEIFEAADTVEGFSGHPRKADMDRFVREKLQTAVKEAVSE
jgi:multiple sugar transport system substrate-binding protein